MVMSGDAPKSDKVLESFMKMTKLVVEHAFVSFKDGSIPKL